MIRKLSKVITLLLVIGCVGFTAPAWGAEQSVLLPGSIKYEMKEVTVQYAAEFTVYPISTPKTTVSKSVYEAVYSNEAKPIQVMYGVVKLTICWVTRSPRSSFGFQMERIVARGLSNGGGPIYNANNQVRGQDTEFVTGKKLAKECR